MGPAWDALRPGDRVVVPDDLVATAGTAEATARLCEQLGAEVLEMALVIQLAFLNPGKSSSNAASSPWSPLSETTSGRGRRRFRHPLRVGKEDYCSGFCADRFDMLALVAVAQSYLGEKQEDHKREPPFEGDMKMGRILPLATILWLASALGSAWGATWCVDASVAESGDGTSWETAFKAIQTAIDKASNGDTVTVARGTYFENIQVRGENIILRSTDPLDPDVVAATIIDGSQAGSVVTFLGNEDDSCVLSGFTLRNGKCVYGGGILGGPAGGARTHATIQNNNITGNWVSGPGGGLCQCSGTIENNTITANYAYDSG
jgi:hypothetical protein